MREGGGGRVTAPLSPLLSLSVSRPKPRTSATCWPYRLDRQRGHQNMGHCVHLAFISTVFWRHCGEWCGVGGQGDQGRWPSPSARRAFGEERQARAARASSHTAFPPAARRRLACQSRAPSRGAAGGRGRPPPPAGAPPPRPFPPPVAIKNQTHGDWRQPPSPRPAARTPPRPPLSLSLSHSTPPPHTWWQVVPFSES